MPGLTPYLPGLLQVQSNNAKLIQPLFRSVRQPLLLTQLYFPRTTAIPTVFHAPPHVRPRFDPSSPSLPACLPLSCSIKYRVPERPIQTFLDEVASSKCKLEQAACLLEAHILEHVINIRGELTMDLLQNYFR